MSLPSNRIIIFGILKFVCGAYAGFPRPKRVLELCMTIKYHLVDAVADAVETNVVRDFAVKGFIKFSPRGSQ